MNIFDNPNSLLEEDLNDFFKKEEEDGVDLLFHTISLLLYKNQHNTDMVQIFKTVGLDNLVKLIQLFDGKTVQFAKDTEFIDTVVLAMVYYLRKIKGISDWEEIQSFFGPFKINSLSLSHKIHGLDEFTKQKLQQMFARGTE